MGSGAKLVIRYMRNVAILTIVLIVAGNLAILAANFTVRATAHEAWVPSLDGVNNLAAVDGHLWRGAAPSPRGYKELADHGVKTVVDLRAERDLDVNKRLLDRLELDRVAIPLRDGQSPTRAQVDEFLRVVLTTEGRVYVHCGAGVGRTGTMAAAYLVRMGKTSAAEALRRNLSVGPPSLEQIAFVASLGGEVHRPSTAVTMLSRVIDGPRRIWVNLTNAYQ